MIGRRLLAEGLGTAILVATVVGSGIMAERLAGGNQAIALLGNTIPTGAILVVLISILGPVSGAHFNPAVTLVFAARGETAWHDVLPYIAVQCVGGIAGTAIAHLMFDLAPLAIGTTARSGAAQWLAEVGRYIYAVAGDPGRHPACAASGALAGGTDHHGRLLVHIVDLVRQSGGDFGARIHHDLRRHRHQSCSGLCDCTIGGRGRRVMGVRISVWNPETSLDDLSRGTRIALQINCQVLHHRHNNVLLHSPKGAFAERRRHGRRQKSRQNGCRTEEIAAGRGRQEGHARLTRPRPRPYAQRPSVCARCGSRATRTLPPRRRRSRRRPRRSPPKSAKAKAQPLSEWLNDQKKDGLQN